MQRLKEVLEGSVEKPKPRRDERPDGCCLAGMDTVLPRWMLSCPDEGCLAWMEAVEPGWMRCSPKLTMLRA